MKKKIYALRKGLFVLLAMMTVAQISSAQVGIGTTTPNASAQLQIESTNKGILIPRVTKQNRPASPVDGLMIYQTTDTAGFYFYKSSTWKRIATSDETGGTAPVNVGSIVPFASGIPSVLTTTLGGMMNTSSIVGFGNNASGVTIPGGMIDLTGGAGVLLNNAFSMPRAGIITSISAYFSTTAAVALIGSTVTITAQVFKSSTPNNSFTAVPGAMVTLAPPFTGLMAIGTIGSGLTTGLSIPVASGERIMLVYTATVTAGIDVSTTIQGYASGGINFN